MGEGAGQTAAEGARPRALARGVGFYALAGAQVATIGLALRAALAEEARGRRLFLWLPVLFGAGVLAYFAADREPALWAPLAATLVFAAAAFTAHRRGAVAAARSATAVAVFFAGFGAATLQTRVAAGPVVRRIIIAEATVYIETVDDYRAGARILARVLAIDGLAPDATPARVRVTLRGRPPFAAGATVRARMRLLPPPTASEPGGYDFARDAYFERIGAVGNVISPLQRAPDAAGVPLAARLNAAVDRARNALTDRIVRVVGGGVGAVTAALVTGKRGLIPESMNDDLRGAGIYHVVSISGLHMVLAAGLFLWSLRALLALFPSVALTRPIKKWAAAFAILGAVAYDVFAGSEVATERSLVMTAIMLVAILFDRPALSLRNLAIAALIVLAREPATLLGPSFQMSFAAVGAMIAAFENRPERAAAGARAPTPGPADRVRVVVLAALATTLVASLATDPYATFHFHRLNPYGLIGNTLTLPIVEFVVMPMSLVGVAAAPFGLDAPCWWVAGQGITFMMAMAHWVSGLAGSTRYVPAFGAGAILLMTAGLLWLALWRTWIRWAGVAFAAAGLALAVIAPRPDVAVDSHARTVALRGAEGALEVLHARANLFGVAQWLTADADARDPADPALIGAARCDRQGCVGTLRDGRILAFDFDRDALAEDCARADIVVTPLWSGEACLGPDLVLDGRWLDGHGAAQIRFGLEGEALIHSDRAPDTDRPWAPARPSPPPTPLAPAQDETQDEADPSLYAP